MKLLNFDLIFNRDIKLSRRLDHVYDIIDSWLINGEFARCDELLQLLIEDYLDSDNLDIMLGFITITIPWKCQLKNREVFVNNVYEKYRELYGENYANRTMAGLL
jgi:hypothetical protein